MSRVFIPTDMIVCLNPRLTKNVSKEIRYCNSIHIVFTENILYSFDCAFLVNINLYLPHSGPSR